uniref:Caspase 23, apoptosis-related cysteine peptidase n=1 Tax=Cyprinus carpio carpio TaxID=630221 RepID=A0A8C1CV67_CYPCA
MTEEDNWDEDLEEDAAIANLVHQLNIHKQHIGKSDRNSEVRPLNERVDFVALPCGHRMPTDYVVAWFKCYLKQKKTEFSCPRFNEVHGKSCGQKLSYQELCQLIPLTDKQREFLEENLAALVARRLFDFKACPGCQSHVERRDRSNLCVNCIICTANLKRNYYFCWSCHREWKGPANNSVQCGNTGCGQRARTSDPLIACKPEFKMKMLREKGDDVSYVIYPIKDKSNDRKRLALLINNVEFKNLEDRTGADKDELSMEVLLKGLGYTVITLRDLSAQGMLSAMRDFAQREEHTESDSCFVVLMSHGDASGISGVFDSFDSEDEEDIFPTDEIFNCLNTPNCAGLRDKPKIILIQACRGDKEGSVDVPDAVPRRNRGKEHREKDFCCLRSCTPDTVSYRNQESGSHFIQDIVEIFNQHAHQDHIEKLFRKVLKKFKIMHPDQMPCKERTTLSKRFFLFPGL